MSDVPLIDKTFDGMLRQMRRNITELQRRLGTLSVIAPDLPLPVQLLGPAMATVTEPAATWGPFSPNVAVTLTPAADLYVMATMSSNAGGNGTVYGMVGVRASGGLNLEPDYDQVTGTQQFAFTAYTSSSVPVTVTASKLLLLPAGVATTLTLMKRRNTTAVAPVVNYSMLQVNPLRYV